MTPLAKQERFHEELKELLTKYKADILLEDFGKGYQIDYKIIVEFEYDESFYKEHGTGIIPDLVL